MQSCLSFSRILHGVGFLGPKSHKFSCKITSLFSAAGIGEDYEEKWPTDRGFTEKGIGPILAADVIPNENIYHFEHRSIVKRSADPSLKHHRSLEQEYRISWFQQQKGKKRVKRSQAVKFNDPRWPQMWYLVYHIMLDQIFGLGTSNIKLHTNTNKIRLEKGVRQGDSISQNYLQLAWKMYLNA
ncbi:Proprotein convertase subtilisin/kexin type 5 [Nymphon striatum]|nr:Proprotein convertase subtilisin/kexin type 5 [Nymphon striatum]